MHNYLSLKLILEFKIFDLKNCVISLSLISCHKTFCETIEHPFSRQPFGIWLVTNPPVSFHCFFFIVVRQFFVSFFCASRDVLNSVPNFFPGFAENSGHGFRWKRVAVYVHVYAVRVFGTVLLGNDRQIEGIDVVTREPQTYLKKSP